MMDSNTKSNSESNNKSSRQQPCEEKWEALYYITRSRTAQSVPHKILEYICRLPAIVILPSIEMRQDTAETWRKRRGGKSGRLIIGHVIGWLVHTLIPRRHVSTSEVIPSPCPL